MVWPLASPHCRRGCERAGGRRDFGHRIVTSSISIGAYRNTIFQAFHPVVGATRWAALRFTGPVALKPLSTTRVAEVSFSGSGNNDAGKTAQVGVGGNELRLADAGGRVDNGIGRT
jgi:hypothetical protein